MPTGTPERCPGVGFEPTKPITRRLRPVRFRQVSCRRRGHEAPGLRRRLPTIGNPSAPTRPLRQTAAGHWCHTLNEPSTVAAQSYIYDSTPDLDVAPAVTWHQLVPGQRDSCQRRWESGDSDPCCWRWMMSTDRAGMPPPNMLSPAAGTTATGWRQLHPFMDLYSDWHSLVSTAIRLRPH